MMSVGHVLDHVLDHMIIGFVTMALQQLMDYVIKGFMITGFVIAGFVITALYISSYTIDKVLSQLTSDDLDQ